MIDEMKGAIVKGRELEFFMKCKISHFIMGPDDYEALKGECNAKMTYNPAPESLKVFHKFYGIDVKVDYHYTGQPKLIIQTEIEV